MNVNKLWLACIATLLLASTYALSACQSNEQNLPKVYVVTPDEIAASLP